MIALPFDHQVPRAKSLQRADSHLFSPDCDQAIADAAGDYPVRPMTAIQFRQERGAESESGRANDAFRHRRQV
jgi:hypothetical protein